MRVSAALIAALLLPQAARAASTGPLTLDALLGDWLHPAYVETLRETRSPVQTYLRLLRLPGAVFLSFRRSEDGPLFEAWPSFHEGDIHPCPIAELRPAVDGGAAIICKDGSRRGTVRLREGVLDWTGSPKHSKTAPGFRRAEGGVETFAAVIALSGRYRDEKGAPVELRADGTARYRGGEYDYCARMDTVTTAYDELTLSAKGDGPTLRWIYQLKKDGLELWTIKEDEESEGNAPDRLVHALRRR